MAERAADRDVVEEIAKLNIDEDRSNASQEKRPGLLKKDVQTQKYDWREGDPYEPCAGCSWTPYESYWHEQYKSDYKLFYVCQSNACWSLGSKVILKDRPHIASNLEADNMRFLKSKTSVPVPSVIYDWTDEDKGRYYLLQEKIEGVPLNEVWNDMAEEHRERIAKQTADYLTQLRGLTAETIQNVRGQPCRDNGLVPTNQDLLGPLSTDDEVRHAIDAKLKEAKVYQELREKPRLRMPPVKPFTFTHGDLSIVNIMVSRDGHDLTGLIDFEWSAYLPCWWEYARNALGFSDEDRVWKEKLCARMKSHNSNNEVGYRWWRACNALVRIPASALADARVRELFEN